MGTGMRMGIGLGVGMRMGTRMGIGVGPGMGMGHSAWEGPRHGHGDHQGAHLRWRSPWKLTQGCTGRILEDTSCTGKQREAGCPGTHIAQRCTGRMPKFMLCTGMCSRDSQGHIWHGGDTQRHRACTGMPRVVQGHIIHQNAQGELSRAVPKGWTCYWLRLKASWKGGDPPMGKPLLSGFLSSQIIHTQKKMAEVWM